MSKYDFELDLSENTSTGMILSKIEKGSTVLEFGCAEGRMTRYMQQTLDCRVYIVELDKAAYDTAAQYAADGVCGDIMDFVWAEKFGYIGFDTIIFADVLEHLTQPEKVLERAAKLLKDTGKLFISAPNITHNDILLKAYGERFDYTATGLLDDTHVHFWGLENLKELSGKFGLHLLSIQGTPCPTGETEQYAEENLPGNTLLKNILRERRGGEIYQFVLTMDKQGDSPAEDRIQTPALRSHLYLDTGADFNARQILALDAQLEADGSYCLDFELEDTENLLRVRLDPVEQQGCILQEITISQAGKALPLQYAKAFCVEEGVFLPGDDPMVLAQVQPGRESICIHAKFLLPGESYLRVMDAAVVELNDSKTALTEENAALQRNAEQLSGANRAMGERIADLDTANQELHGIVAKLDDTNRALGERIADLDTANQELHGIVAQQDETNRQLQDKLAGMFQENQKLYQTLTELSETAQQLQQQTIILEQTGREEKGKVKNLTGEKAQLEMELSIQRQENDALRTDVGSYIVLVNKKDAYALELEQQRDANAQRAEEIQRYYSNLEVVRLRRFVGRVLKGIWRRVKRLFGRG